MNREQMIAHLTLLGYVAIETSPEFRNYAKNGNVAIGTRNDVYFFSVVGTHLAKCPEIPWGDMSDQDVRGIFECVMKGPP
jgi:hypothetical protein